MRSDICKIKKRGLLQDKFNAVLEIILLALRARALPKPMSPSAKRATLAIPFRVHWYSRVSGNALALFCFLQFPVTAPLIRQKSNKATE
jgi:hypothetical protein